MQQTEEKRIDHHHQTNEDLSMFGLSLFMMVFFGLLALIPLQVQRSNGRNLQDWLESPDPEHMCQVNDYNQSNVFGGLLKNCHCQENCYGSLVPCRLLRPVLELDPTKTSPNLNYGLGEYCCDQGNCFGPDGLYTCTVLTGNISGLSWTWELKLDNTTWSQWQQHYYCLSDDLECQRRATMKHFVGKRKRCWIQHWKQGQVTLSYPGPYPLTIGIFWALIALAALPLFMISVLACRVCVYLFKYVDSCFLPYRYLVSNCEKHSSASQSQIELMEFEYEDRDVEEIQEL